MNEWFQNFCVRLLEADGEVLRLLERDPFEGRRPRYIRAVLYRYRFSDTDDRRSVTASGGRVSGQASIRPSSR